MENGNDKNNTFFRFEDLRIYHKALNYTQWISEVCSNSCPDQQSALVGRFNTSSHNIVLNIDEGSARNKTVHLLPENGKKRGQGMPGIYKYLLQGRIFQRSGRRRIKDPAHGNDQNDRRPDLLPAAKQQAGRGRRLRPSR